MKTNIAYTVKARQVTFNPAAVITVAFKGGFHYTGELGGLAAYVTSTDTRQLQGETWWVKRGASQPLGCTTELGRHGIYPCILATSKELAKALSLLSGDEIVVGDGVTYPSRARCLDDASALFKAGFKLTGANLAWGITEQAYAPTAPAKPVNVGQPTLEEQFADCPF